MRNYTNLIAISVFLFSFLCGSPSFAQETASTACDVPVTVRGWNKSSKSVELLKNLAPTNFEVEIGSHLVSLRNATVDAGPKRVVLVLDASKKVADSDWQLSVEMAISLVSNARESDGFAFVIVDSDGSDRQFLKREEAINRLRQLKSVHPVNASASGRIYDAVLEASDDLLPSQFGDTIFFFGRTEDSGSKANPDTVREILLQRRIGLYGVTFEELPIVASFSSGKPKAKLAKDFEPGKIDEISHDTGHYFSFRNPSDFTGPQRPLVEQFFADLYAGIAAPYRFQFSDTGTKDSATLWIKVRNAKEYKIDQNDVRYPRILMKCTNSLPSIDESALWLNFSRLA